MAKFGVIYKTTYEPNIGIYGEPKYYIGSTSKNNENYFGSVSSKRWKDWWKRESKTNPQNFKKEVICCCISDDVSVLHLLEKDIQKQYDVVHSDEYFNMAYATTGYFGVCATGEKNPNYGKPVSVETRIKQSISRKKLFLNEDFRIKQVESAKEVASRPEIIENKRRVAKYNWEHFPEKYKNNNPITKQIHLVDVSFKSTKIFKQYLKEMRVTSTLLDTLIKNKIQLYDENFSLDDFVEISVLYSGFRRLLTTLYIYGYSATDVAKFYATRLEGKHMKDVFDMPWSMYYAVERFIEIRTKNSKQLLKINFLKFIDKVYTIKKENKICY